jgi:hypothetical protein
VLADQAPTSARKTPPDSKTNDTTVFIDSIGQKATLRRDDGMYRFTPESGPWQA